MISFREHFVQLRLTARLIKRSIRFAASYLYLRVSGSIDYITYTLFTGRQQQAGAAGETVRFLSRDVHEYA